MRPLFLAIACVLALAPLSQEAHAASARDCRMASITANKLIKESRKLRAYGKTMSTTIKSSGPYYKSHYGARNYQNFIVTQYASYFKDQQALTLWQQHKLRRSHVLSRFAKYMKLYSKDLKKLKGGGYKWQKIKSGGFKLYQKKSCLPLRYEGRPCGVQDDAPCLKATAFNKNSASYKKFTKFSKYFTKSKLKSMQKAMDFIKLVTKAKIKTSIDYTKKAISYHRRYIRPMRSRFRRTKRNVKSLRRKLKRYLRACRIYKRKRTSNFTPSPTRKCGSSNPTPLTSVCWRCQSMTNADAYAESAMLDPLVGSFEGNFQTAGTWVETDTAYNTGAETAYTAASTPIP